MCCAVVLPTHADEERVKEDINEVGTTDQEILNLITRSNEDASTELESDFEGLIDFTIVPVPPFFTQLATELTTSYYWVKESGTEEAKKQREEVRAKAKLTLEKRFFPSSESV